VATLQADENRNTTKPIDKATLTSSDLSSSLTDFAVVKEFEESPWVDDEPDLNSSNVVQQLIGDGAELDLNNNNDRDNTNANVFNAEEPNGALLDKQDP